MTYTIQYDPENNCIMASMKGDVSLKKFKEFVNILKQKIEKYNCNKIFNDVRKINSKLSTFEIYYLPKEIKKAGINEFCKRALVVANDLKDIEFFETVCVNNGQCVKIFRDPDDAIEWLRK